MLSGSLWAPAGTPWRAAGVLERSSLDQYEARWHFLELIRADLWLSEERDSHNIDTDLARRLLEVVDDLAGLPCAFSARPIKY